MSIVSEFQNIYSVSPPPLSDFFGDGTIEKLRNLLEARDPHVVHLAEIGDLTGLLSLIEGEGKA